MFLLAFDPTNNMPEWPSVWRGIVEFVLLDACQGFLNGNVENLKISTCTTGM